MKWIFDNDRPIYMQIVENLKLSIISGIYKQGEKMPSVRELACEIKVNPNTMQKALTELEESKLVYTQRTSGRFVTNDAERIAEEKNILALEKASAYSTQMKKLGFSENEAIQYLQRKGREK